ncbi:hypothetical protein [Duganella violaceipulchra]|uniref:Uncharacterized protein n=1 Tax=Duganella violaceipulchra TaxID=2849652 RepID=A0AA41HI12_9BURK|nr:hypothetical protein [Duganella violaceicalia]MBV6324904.1 hypothetical protein [Duganella violaceicalia]MCP2012348.1 hypothetical protein [Duganella violaceicalia]
MAIAGRGGRGGVGKGGQGGDAVALHDDSIYYGGDGGEANQHDGRGGRGGAPQMLGIIDGAEYARRAAMKLPYGAPNTFVGRGGDTPDTPQYMARRLIVERIKIAYYVAQGIPTEGVMALGRGFRMMPEEWQRSLTAKYSDVWYDREIVPLTWINEQVRQAGNKWTVAIEAEEYIFADSDAPV